MPQSAQGTERLMCSQCGETRLPTGIPPGPKPEKREEYMKKKALGPSFPLPRYTVGARTRTDNSLKAEGRILDTEAFVTIARPDITAGLPERSQPMRRALQTPSRETLHILLVVLVQLTLGPLPLTWAFVACACNDWRPPVAKAH